MFFLCLNFFFCNLRALLCAWATFIWRGMEFSKSGGNISSKIDEDDEGKELTWPQSIGGEVVLVRFGAGDLGLGLIGEFVFDSGKLLGTKFWEVG